MEEDAPGKSVSRRQLLGLGLSRLARELDAQRALERLEVGEPAVPAEDLRDAWGRPDAAGFARLVEPAAEHLVEACGVSAGERVLDAGCGDGNVALAAARRGAIVTAVDYSPSALERGRARAAAEGLEVEWLDGDVQDLPAGDGWFDRSLSAFGLIWAADVQTALDELIRVTRPEGTLGLAVWARAGFYGGMLSIAEDHGLFEWTNPADWGREEPIRRELEPFADEVRFENHRLPLGIDSPEAAFRLVAESPGPVGAGIDLLPKRRREALRADVQALAARHALGDGGVEAHWIEVVAAMPPGIPEGPVPGAEPGD